MYIPFTINWLLTTWLHLETKATGNVVCPLEATQALLTQKGPTFLGSGYTYDEELIAKLTFSHTFHSNHPPQSLTPVTKPSYLKPLTPGSRRSDRRDFPGWPILAWMMLSFSSHSFHENHTDFSPQPSFSPSPSRLSFDLLWVTLVQHNLCLGTLSNTLSILNKNLLYVIRFILLHGSTSYIKTV